VKSRHEHTGRCRYSCPYCCLKRDALGVVVFWKVGNRFGARVEEVLPGGDERRVAECSHRHKSIEAARACGHKMQSQARRRREAAR